MPNSRRRKFSVKKNLHTREIAVNQNAVQQSSTKNFITTNICKSDEQTSPNTSKPTSNHKIILQKTSGTILLPRKCIVESADKNIAATVSRKDTSNIQENETFFLPCCDKSFVTSNLDTTITPLQLDKHKTQPRRERHYRQHRIKVRSPKRRILLSDDKSQIILERSTGTNTDDLKSIIYTPNVESLTTASSTIGRLSSNSMEDMCRICHGGDAYSQELGTLISACSCRGTIGKVHVRCLERWLTESGKSRCELCGIRYVTERVHRYGMPRALVMWILSQNAKQLMVDTLGIMLMSPLAIMAAWISGRTFAGLISQENHASPTPWPLASTFVLACMTLVCYYCWIVSAATRHALSWWIWYRSQYEVRLQLHTEPEE